MSGKRSVEHDNFEHDNFEHDNFEHDNFEHDNFEHDSIKHGGIERNVKTIAVLGVFVFASLVIALATVQSSLGRSISKLSNEVVPIQNELGKLSDSVSAMFLSQYEITTSGSDQDDAVTRDDRKEAEAEQAKKRLRHLLSDASIQSHKSFPVQAARGLESEVDRFLDTRVKLFAEASDHRVMTEALRTSKTEIDKKFKRLIRHSSSFAGILRLNHIAALRKLSEQLQSSEIERASVRVLVHGESRALRDQIQSFNLATQKLESLSEKIADARNIDVLNSLKANKLAQIVSKLQESLDRIERMDQKDRYDHQIGEIRHLAGALMVEITGDKGDSLVNQRLRLLRTEQKLDEYQVNASRSAVALQASTSALMRFSKNLAVERSDRAAQTIFVSRVATFLISFIGLMIMIFAALRVRRSVLALRAQNQRLEELSQRLKDSVSGLEDAVAKRTESLQLVLDSVGEGMLTVALDGRILPERSKTIADWFGEPQNDIRLWGYLADGDQAFADHFEASFEQIVEGVFPFEVAADQAPNRLHRGSRTYELAYRAIDENGSLARMLVVANDITEKLEAQRSERKIQHLQNVLGNLLRDRAGFCDSIRECGQLIHAVLSCRDLISSRRILHTIKGNCAIMDFESVADYIHGLESKLDEQGRLPNQDELDELESVWNDELVSMGAFLDVCDYGTKQVRDDELSEVLALLEDGARHSEILPIVQRWYYEPLSVPLERLSKQARRLAEQLDKQVEVKIDDGGLYLPADRLKELWTAMVHLVRNSIDHGIEPPDKRKRLTKDETGTLRFCCDTVNGWLEIQIADDGQGIDWDRVRAKARQLGMQPSTDQEIAELLFSDNFTTRDTVTEISGRGVGLAAVRSVCESLNGSVSVASECGIGTTFTIRLPWLEGLQHSPAPLRTWRTQDRGHSEA